MDQQLLEILVCPQCKGGISLVDGQNALLCDRCKLKFPVRDGIPIMLVEEAYDMRRGGRKADDASVKLPRVNFRVVGGADANMTFQVEHGSCRAIGRASADPNRTQVFNVDITLGLDESTKGLILQYVGRQFSRANADLAPTGERFGQFRRAPDIILTDPSLSRLHAMIFADASGIGVLDLVSKNGTFVNGQEVESVILKRQDTIEMGKTVILFEG